MGVKKGKTAVFLPTERRNQKKYFQTNLIKGLLPLAIQAVVNNTIRFLSNILFREGTDVLET
jgi:hypothetical protein